MHSWHTLTFVAAIGGIAACGSSDKHADTPVDTQGSGATSGAGPSGAPGVPPSDTPPPTTPNSEPNNVPPESRFNPKGADPNTDLSSRSTLGSPAAPHGYGGSSMGSGGRGGTGSGGVASKS
jgi:hypothetical protein